jgi:hypothetical protein
MLTVPVSFAPRLRTQPPQPRMAPVRVCTSRDGSSMEMAFICIAHGMLIASSTSWSGIVSLTPLLSEPAPSITNCPESHGI